MLQVLAGVGRLFDRWSAAIGLLPLLVGLAGLAGSLFFGAKVVFGGPSATEIAAGKRAAVAETIAGVERAGAEVAAKALARARAAEEMAGKARADAAAAETARREAWQALQVAEAKAKARATAGKCLSDAAVRRINAIRRGSMK